MPPHRNNAHGKWIQVASSVMLRPENLHRFTSQLHINHSPTASSPPNAIRILGEARVNKTKALRTRTNDDPLG
jgi:hypothetical protein